MRQAVRRRPWTNKINMAVKKFVVGCFYDEQVLFPAVKGVRKAGYKIHDVYTPFPIHGLDAALGLRDTSLHTAGFIYGITGTTTALSFITWAFTTDWPYNIGGKPQFVCGSGHCAYFVLPLSIGTICE